MALDWYYPSDDGRLLAYGLSENGGEQSVLQVMDVDTGVLMPSGSRTPVPPTLAWLPDSTGFYYTRYPSPGQAPEGEEHYHRVIHFHRLGTDPTEDPLVFKPAEKEHWPSMRISPDGRWLVIGVARTFDQTDLYVMDRWSGAQVAVAQDLPASFDGEVAHGRLFMRTLDAPTYRLYVVDPERPERERWKEIVPPRAEAVLEGVHVTARHLALDYLSGRLPGSGSPTTRAATLASCACPRSAACSVPVPSGTGRNCSTASRRTPCLRACTGSRHRSRGAWLGVDADVDPSRFEVRQVSVRSKDGTEVSMFLVHRTGLVKDGRNPYTSPGTAASTSV